jgi:general secretion pathway protein D
MKLILWLAIGVCAAVLNSNVEAQQDTLVVLRNDSVSIRFVDTDLRAAVQALARHLSRPVIITSMGEARVTLETPSAVPRAELPVLLQALLDSHNYVLRTDSGFYRIEQKQEEPRPSASAPGAVSEQSGTIQLFVIRLRHAAAADVAATVNALYGRASVLGELGATNSLLSDQLRRNQVPPAGALQPSPIPQAGTSPASLSGDVTIVPDAGTNSLLIRASQSDFQLIENAVAQLDIRPLQVLIEVLIAEVRRDRSFSFGLGLGLDTMRIPGRLGVDGNVAASNAGLGLGDFVLSLMNIEGLQLDATLRAAAARGDVSIKSRPVLVAANNETAQILVGSQRPFVQVSRSLPTDLPSRDQVVQYKEVGTHLTIHPTISADGYIMLDVTQEVNAATTETAFEAPVISTRSVKTRLLVKDGQTAVLGGLTDHQRDQNKGGIPLLSDIPILGGLFGSQTQRAVATELFLFLTPRVIRTDQDVDDATQPLIKRTEKIKK